MSFSRVMHITPSASVLSVRMQPSCASAGCDAEATACLADVPLIWYILWLQKGKGAADGDASEEGEL